MPLPVEKLDTSRPHGQVYGENAHNIAYEQKALGLPSWPYDAHGVLIEAALTEAQTAKLKERRAIAAKQPAPTKALKFEPVEDELEEGEKAGNEVVDEGDDEVNLVMWLKGEARYKPFEIQNAIKKRYGANKPKPVEAALYLVEEQKVLPRSLVAPSILPAVAA